jgi:hypothetical protein
MRRARIETLNISNVTFLHCKTQLLEADAMTQSDYHGQHGPKCMDTESIRFLWNNLRRFNDDFVSNFENGTWAPNFLHGYDKAITLVHSERPFS